MKRFLRIILCVSIFCAISCMSSVSAFSDTEGHWAKDVIKEMADKGIIHGFEDGTFRPNDNVTREQFAKLLVETLDLQDTGKRIEFVDVQEERWSYNYIQIASDYLTAYTNNNQVHFKPEEISVREDIAVATVLASGLGDEMPNMEVLDEFSDKDNISPNLKKYVAIAVQNEIMRGKGGYFDPNAPLTRAEVSQLLYNVIKGEEVKVVLGDVNGDGRITQEDLAYINEYIQDCTSSIIIKNADVDNDGKITEKDSRIISKYYEGIITSLPHICEYVNGVCKCGETEDENKILPTSIVLNAYDLTICQGLDSRCRFVEYEVPLGYFSDFPNWIYATVFPEIASLEGVEKHRIKWNVDNPSILTINERGIVSIHNKGTCVLTVTTVNGLKATCTVKVVDHTVGKQETKYDEEYHWIQQNCKYCENEINIVNKEKHNFVNGKCECGQTTDVILPTSIKLNRSDATICVGINGVDTNMKLSTLLVPTILPNNVTDNTITWTSSDPSILYIDEKERVIATGKGTAKLIATTVNGLKASCIVKIVDHSCFTSPRHDEEYHWDLQICKHCLDDMGIVNKEKHNFVNGKCECGQTTDVILPTSIKLNRSDATICVGINGVDTNMKLSTLLVPTILPNNVTDNTITWTSSDPSILYIDEKERVIATGKGTAKLIATTVNGLKASCIVKIVDHSCFTSPRHDEEYHWDLQICKHCLDDMGIVNKEKHNFVNGKCECGQTTDVILPTSIKLSKSSITVCKGYTNFKIDSTISPNNVTDDTIKWTSSNSGVVIVDKYGTVVVGGKGTAVISATTVNGLKATCTVKVEDHIAIIQESEYDTKYHWDLQICKHCLKDMGIENEEEHEYINGACKCGVLKGDANKDGKVKTLDGLIILQYLEGMYDNINLENADVNLDGEVTERDAEIIANYIVGNIRVLPHICEYVNGACKCGVLKGDANKDGKVDTLDGARISQYLEGMYDDINLENADVNLDGEITQRDVDLVMKYIVGIIASLPHVCEYDDGVCACGVLKGDANKDGKVDTLDGARILQYLEGTLENIDKENADVDLDGKVTEKDAEIIMSYTVGKIKVLPYI